jgi:hypothetical protein
MKELVQALIREKKLPGITEYVDIRFGNKGKSVHVVEYAGTDMRIVPKGNKIHVLCPKEMTVVQEGHLANALVSGSIFDDAETIENTTKYVTSTTLPQRGMATNRLTDDRLSLAVSGVVGRVSDDGTVGSSADIENGRNFLDDACKPDMTDRRMSDTLDHYMGNKDYVGLPMDIKTGLVGADEEASKISEIDPEDSLDKDDYDEIDMEEGKSTPLDLSDNGDDIVTKEHLSPADDHLEQEGFLDGLFADKNRMPSAKDLNNAVMTIITVLQNADDYVGADKALRLFDVIQAGRKTLKPGPESYLDETQYEVLVNLDIHMTRLSHCNGDRDISAMYYSDYPDEAESHGSLGTFEEERDKVLEYAEQMADILHSKTDMPVAESVTKTPGPSTNSIQWDDGGGIETEKKKKKMRRKKGSEELRDRMGIKQEGFFNKAPKKLKPITRQTIVYIQTSIAEIRDANDRSILAGYCASKLELVDFYLTVLDTQDERYIVPHNRQYLTAVQTQLNALLAQILSVKVNTRTGSTSGLRVNYLV